MADWPSNQNFSSKQTPGGNYRYYENGRYVGSSYKTGSSSQNIYSKSGRYYGKVSPTSSGAKFIPSRRK